MLVWRKAHHEPVCRFGIAGDFLPAAGLSPTGDQTWFGQAKPLAALFRQLEFSIVNLECPVGVGQIPPRVKASLGDSFAAETSSLDYLRALGVSVVGLANNHLYDYGSSGAERTLENVRREFSACGFGRTLAEAPSVCIRETSQDLPIGIWAAARNLPDGPSRSSAGIEPATRERAAQALGQMETHGVRCRLALLHAGAEGTNYPDPEDAEFMEELAKMGFDVVAACHSHRISGYQTVRGKTGAAHCFYGLGSLSSGVFYSPLEHEGILARISLDASGAVSEVEAQPIYLDERGWGTVPSQQESEMVLNRFRAISASLEDGSYRQQFYRDISRDMMGAQWRDVRIAFERAGLRGILNKLTRMRPAHVRRLYHKSLRSIGLD
jgi:capsule synthesis protein PGA_cap